MHTKDKLAAELRKAGLTAMAEKAATGWYHDFLSPLAMPCQQLATDLTTYANAPSWPRRAEAKALLDRHLKGEFDASREESEAWAQSQDGKETFAALIPERSDAPPTPPNKKDQIGRLALREEGEFWNAYYAEPDTLKEAVLLGSIRMALVVKLPERKAAFMDLMREVVSDVIEGATGHRPVWPKPGGVAAPEHERSTRA